MGRSLHLILHYKIGGGQPYDLFTSYALHTHKMWSLYIEVTTSDQNLGFKPQKFPWGILCPTDIHHKHCDSPIESLCQCGDLCVKTSQLCLDRCKIGNALSNCLLYFLDALFKDHYGWTTSLNLFVCSLHLRELWFNRGNNDIRLMNPWL